LQRLWVVLALTIVVLLAAFYLTRGGPVLAVLGFALAAWVGIGALAERAERMQLFRAPLGESWRRARHLPRASWGMTLAHLGLAVTVVGISASAFDLSHVGVMRPGNDITLAGYTLRLDGVAKAPGANFTAERATIEVRRGNDLVATLHPETRFFPLQQTTTSLTAIHTTFLSDLYLALGQADGKGGWTVRAFFKPFVPWIWIGAVIMAFGGMVSLSDRRWRVGVARRVRRAPPLPAAAE